MPLVVSVVEMPGRSAFGLSWVCFRAVAQTTLTAGTERPVNYFERQQAGQYLARQFVVDLGVHLGMLASMWMRLLIAQR